MRFSFIAILATAASATAQKVSGTAYGFATGVTGGGAAQAVTPTTNEELASYLSDSTARTILLTKTFDFTGKTTTGAGCDRKSCSVSGGGQYYLGDLSCGGSDNVAVSSITYDPAGPGALPVGSNKSILGVGGKGVIKGKGLSLQKNAKNVIIQGIEITSINPGVVWGGDGLDFQGGNDGVWVDHCKFSLIGRMFVVSHYAGSSITLSNNEFDGVTTTSATCNDNHYWGLMFIANGDKVTLDKNYFHNLSGRAPKLGADGVSGTFHAVNNLFSNMKGHAFDAYKGANALIEGNAFASVSQPSTQSAAGVSTFVVNAGNACSSAFGRDCLANSVDSSSGKLSGGSTTSFVSSLAKFKIPNALSADKVSAHVKANAGPAKLGSTNADANEGAVSNPKPTQAAATTFATSTKVAAATSKAVAPAPSAPATGSGSGVKTVALYGQCGGSGYTGPTACASGAVCKKQNDWYSQCLASSKARRS
ncbi:carbohydrate-binding module family 1 protein, partial [Aaosphaeria arxii CBS 175.79]